MLYWEIAVKEGFIIDSTADPRPRNSCTHNKFRYDETAKCVVNIFTR